MNLLKKLQEATQNEERTYKIEANKDTFDRLEKLFACLEYCNNGSSRAFIFGQDGDGADRFKVTPKPPTLSEEDKETISNGGSKVNYSVVNVGGLGEKE